MTLFGKTRLHENCIELFSGIRSKKEGSDTMGHLLPRLNDEKWRNCLLNDGTVALAKGNLNENLV